MKIPLKIFIISSLLLTISCLKEDDGIISVPPIQGKELAAEVGGPAQPHQVWVDLSSGEMKKTVRTDWDLGFYSGNEFAVILNTSALMSASPIEGVTNLNEVNSQSVAYLLPLVQVATFTPDNLQYIDDVKGNYLDNGTVIKELNTVYLINMGYGIYDGSFSSGTAYAAGNARGWMKIKITEADDDSYTIQYASLNDTTFEETVITKEPSHNFTFFSLVNGNIADIQPAKKQWDICFTVFVNEVPDLNGNSQGSYIFSDFVISNTMSGTSVYEVITNESTLLADFNNFTSADVDASLFTANDHRVIGDHWRIIPGAIVRKDRFYVLKDPNGILFKIRFISMTKLKENDPNFIERGHPVFEYDPL